MVRSTSVRKRSGNAGRSPDNYEPSEFPPTAEEVGFRVGGNFAEGENYSPEEVGPTHSSTFPPGMAMGMRAGHWMLHSIVWSDVRQGTVPRSILSRQRILSTLRKYGWRVWSVMGLICLEISSQRIHARWTYFLTTRPVVPEEASWVTERLEKQEGEDRGARELPGLHVIQCRNVLQ